MHEPGEATETFERARDKLHRPHVYDPAARNGAAGAGLTTKGRDSTRPGREPARTGETRWIRGPAIGLYRQAGPAAGLALLRARPLSTEHCHAALPARATRGDQSDSSSGSPPLPSSPPPGRLQPQAQDPPGSPPSVVDLTGSLHISPRVVLPLRARRQPRLR